MSTILIVDGNPSDRLSIRKMLEEDGHEITGETSNGAEAVHLAREVQPEITLVDILIPILSGLDVISRIKHIGVPTKVLVVTAQPACVYASRCMKAGASGYINKGESLNKVVEAVKAIRLDYTYFPRAVFSSCGCPEEMAQLEMLTNREIIVLHFLVKGERIKDIATSMLLSEKTVSTYKSRIMQKLKVANIHKLFHCANRCGIH